MGSVVSRESSFLFNNLVLLVSCFAVLWGTMFPVLSEWVQRRQDHGRCAVLQRGERADRDLPAFPDRRRSAAGMAQGIHEQLEAQLPVPAAIALAAACRCTCWACEHFYAWLSLVMSMFVGITIVREFYKGARARSHGTGENFIEAIVNLTMRNTRRYGGYIDSFRLRAAVHRLVRPGIQGEDPATRKPASATQFRFTSTICASKTWACRNGRITWRNRHR